MKILIVENDHVSYLVLQHYLKNNYDNKIIDIRHQDNGDDGIREQKIFKPDIIFMDIHMGKKSGLDQQQEIRKWEEENGHKSYMIGYTADVLKSTKKEIDKYMDFYIMKPVDLKSLDVIFKEITI